MHSLIPDVDHHCAHRRPAGDLKRLVLVLVWLRSLSWFMVAVASAILDIESKQGSKVVQIGTHRAGAPSAVALASQTNLANRASGGTTRVHDLLFTDIVSNIVDAASNHSDTSELLFEAVSCGEVQCGNEWRKLKSHLDQLSLLSSSLSGKDERVFKLDISFIIDMEILRLVKH